MKPPVRIAVTGGAGQIAYALLFRIASGQMLGPDQPVILSLLEIPEAVAFLEGVKMELDDCAFPLLKGVEISSDPNEGFDQAKIALLVGATPRGPGMERKDLLAQNSKIFIQQGKALGERAANDPLIFVVGNPCNTNALIAMHQAKQIDRSRFFAMTRLDQNRASSLLAQKAGVGVEEVKRVTIWGNHSATQVPDFSHALIGGKPAEEVIGDRSWLEGPFVERVQKRGAEVIAARGKSSAASAANGVIDSIASLMRPTPEGEWFSVGLCSDGNPYGVEEDLIFSFPCRSKGEGQVEIVEGLVWDEFLKGKIGLTEKELIEEREAVQ